MDKPFKMKNLAALMLLPLAASTGLRAQSRADFCHKWDLHGYVYWGFTFDPDEIEQGDYLRFNADGTYSGLDQGKPDAGTWTWTPARKELLLADDAKQNLRLEVESLSPGELVVIAKGQGDDIEIIFTRQP